MAHLREPGAPGPGGLLLDIDGVVATGDVALPGSVEAIRRVAGIGVPVRFVTNTTRRPRRAILEALRGMGLEVAGEDVFTPAAAAAALLSERGQSPFLVVHPDLAEDFAGAPVEGLHAVVIGDAGEYFTYARLNEAYRALVHGADFYALAKNRNFHDRDGDLSLDAGPFVAALEYASRRRATVLGKPSPDFFRHAAASIAAAPETILMIGDDAEADVGGAIDAGLRGVLVRTGKYRDGDETRLTRRPEAVEDDLRVALLRLFPD